MTDSLALFYDIVNSEFFRDAQVSLLVKARTLLGHSLPQQERSLRGEDQTRSVDNCIC